MLSLRGSYYHGSESSILGRRYSRGKNAVGTVRNNQKTNMNVAEDTWVHIVPHPSVASTGGEKGPKWGWSEGCKKVQEKRLESSTIATRLTKMIDNLNTLHVITYFGTAQQPKLQKANAKHSRTEDRTQNHLGTCSVDCERDIITIRPCDCSDLKHVLYQNFLMWLHTSRSAELSPDLGKVRLLRTENCPDSEWHLNEPGRAAKELRVYQC